jgi:3-oxoacyl-[acyl-carrier-protein] synthase III
MLLCCWNSRRLGIRCIKYHPESIRFFLSNPASTKVIAFAKLKTDKVNVLMLANLTMRRLFS